MAELFQGDSGKLYVKLPGNRYGEVSPDQAKFIQENGFEAFINAAKNSAAQIPVGTAAIFAPDARPHFQQLQQEQQSRSMGNPGATMAGSVLPDVAIGAATMGSGSVANQALRAGFTEAALGAARNPDDPLVGAAVQGATGAVLGAGFARGTRLADSVITRSRARNAARSQPNEVAPRSAGGDGQFGSSTAGAGQVVDPEYPRPLAGFMTPDEADAMGLSLTNGERMALGARTPDELRIANRMRDREDLMSSQRVLGTDLRGEDILPAKWVKQDQTEWLTNQISKELGEDFSNLTAARRGELRNQTQQVFQKHINKNEKDIPATNAGLDIIGIAENAGVNSKPKLDKLADKVKEILNREGRQFKPDEFASLRASVSNDMNRAFKAGNHELGSALSQVQEALDDALEKVIQKTDPAAMADLRTARTRWSILKALERTSAVDPGGVVNVRSFYNAYRANKPSVKSGTAQAKGDNEFLRMLETVNYLASRQTGNSGTAERLMFAGLGAAPAGVGIGAVTGLGGSLLD